MEKKKTQRIIGISVIVALILIMLPLMFGKNEVPIQQTRIQKAPPFPDRPFQPNTTADKLLTKLDTLQHTNPAPSSPVVSKVAPEQPKTVEKIVEKKVEAAPPIKSIEAAVKPVVKPVESARQDVQVPEQNALKMAQTLENDSSVIVLNPDKSVTLKPKSAKASNVNKVRHSAKSHPIRHKKVAALKPEQHLKKLKSPAWVVQMGNFRVKENAQHLTDKLRASGFKAFTREVKAKSGNTNTRVYIGPEFKLTSAQQLSNQIHQKMNMQGLVIMYKPLEL